MARKAKAKYKAHTLLAPVAEEDIKPDIHQPFKPFSPIYLPLAAKLSASSYEIITFSDFLYANGYAKRR